MALEPSCSAHDQLSSGNGGVAFGGGAELDNAGGGRNVPGDIANRNVGAGGQGQRVIGAGVDNRANAGGASPGNSHDNLSSILQPDSIPSRGSFNGDASEGMGEMAGLATTAVPSAFSAKTNAPS